MRLRETIEVKSNLKLTLRERGKIVGLREGHNIFLNLGREWLASLICYSSYAGSPTTERDDRIRYMGFGIGGTRQSALSVANSAPMTPDYAGTNLQTDIDPTATQLERPVRVSGASDAFPFADPSNLWLAQVQAPVLHPVSTSSQFQRLFQEVDVSYAPFLAVPLSEVALFTNSANPALYNNTGVAYDTFDTITKTSAFAIEVDWTIQF